MTSASSKMPRWIASAGILVGSLIATYAPLPGFQHPLMVVSGSELQEPLSLLEETFEQRYPHIDVQLEFQGSQDMIDRYRNDQNQFTPAILIPASSDFLEQLDPSELADPPQTIVKTYLVGVVWPERADALFPSGQWNWERLETALQSDRRDWRNFGGQADWGSFDLKMTDPSRSNSGQLALSLWAEVRLGENLTAASFNEPTVRNLLQLVKGAVYQPARSTDVLLQDFITQAPNDADVALVYESTALYRWSQASVNQGKAYQLFYPNPTFETAATAAILRRQVDRKTHQAARQFLDFIQQPEQQTVFVRYGFRSSIPDFDLLSVADSPWTQNIPGTQLNPAFKIKSPPSASIIQSLIQAWEQVP